MKMFSRRLKCKVVFICLILAALLMIFYISTHTVFEVIPDEFITNNLVSLGTEKVETVCHVTNDAGTDLQDLLPNVTSKDDAWISNLNISEGGEWHPVNCLARYLVGIVIPYRNRTDHLQIFLNYMHHFLPKQNVHYKIFVIEQSEKKKFNRGKLLNIGFSEAMKDKKFPCFIFHDVDLLPVNLKNIYACTRFPRHMAVGVEKYGYKVPYDRYFGGVTSILADQFLLVNGFSNNFYGWGGEDDDFFNRIRNSNLRVIRFSPEISKYVSLFHKQAEPSEDRYNKLREGTQSYRKDGLNFLNYVIKEKVYTRTHTRIVVDV